MRGRSLDTLTSLQCRDGARRVFTVQAGIACTGGRGADHGLVRGRSPYGHRPSHTLQCRDGAHRAVRCREVLVESREGSATPYREPRVGLGGEGKGVGWFRVVFVIDRFCSLWS